MPQDRSIDDTLNDTEVMHAIEWSLSNVMGLA